MPVVERWSRRALWASLLAFAVCAVLQDIRCFDYWWHLRTGEWIAQTGQVPRVDPFSYTVRGERWIDVHWLHQLGVYGLYRLGGHAAVVVGQAALALLLVALLAPIGYRRERPFVTGLALGLMLLVAGDRFSPRPEVESFVFLAAVLLLLDRFTRRPDARVYAIGAVQLLWVNLHGLFALGIAVCAIYLAAELLRPLLAPGERLAGPRLRRLAALTALAAGISLVNPNLWEGALYPLQQLAMIGPPEERGVFGSLILELIPPIGGSRGAPPLALGLFAALAALSFAAMVANWRRLHGADPLLWVAFLYLALGAQRNLALFAIAAAPILVRNLNPVLDALPARPRARAAASAVLAGLLAALAVDAGSGRLYPRLGSFRTPGLGTMDDFHPVGAAAWIERERPPGPIGHHMADGGYLIWRLPDYPVMVDGRLEVYGARRFVELQLGDPANLRALDERYHFGTLLVHYSLVRSDDLMRWLHLSPRWRLAFVDDAAAVYVRSDWQPRRREPDLDAPDLLPPLAGPAGTEDLMRRLARTHLWTATRRYERALALWKETLERYPDLPQGRIVHAALLRLSGFGAASEAILRALVAETPDDPSLHTKIGDLQLESGDLEGARSSYDAALAREPNFLYGLARRALVAEATGDPDEAARLYQRVLLRSRPADPLALEAALRLQSLLGAGRGRAASGS